MGELKYGILYISLYNRISKKACINKTIKRKEFFTILGKHFLIPKNIRPLIIIELERMNLVETQSNGDIKILNCDINIEEDASKLYKMIGLF